jgi:hypothetical protein
MRLWELATSMGRIQEELDSLKRRVNDLSDSSSDDLTYLRAEQSQLHTLVTARLEAQMDFLNQEIHGLKRRMYHPGATEDTRAFNGQFSKVRIFDELCAAFPFEGFIETGTHVGWTTEHLCRKGKPVYSAEIQAEHYARAEERLRNERQLHLFLGDSVEFLRAGVWEDLGKADLLFFYLDAHWLEHLPLREELDLIATEHARAVVMIDDFKVEDDPGYGYDSYGRGQEITLEFLKDELRCHGWQVFFPALPSTHDHMTTDILPPRGTAVMACAPEVVDVLRRVPSLRFWPLPKE